MTGAMLVDRLGRRTLFIISNAGMLVGELINYLYHNIWHFSDISLVFGAWTVTTALYNTLGIKAAAKGRLLTYSKVVSGLTSK